MATTTTTERDKVGTSLDRRGFQRERWLRK